jgi:hypothetical protein|nr:MAG TPA_asm: hypothetical protein [Caudoviricetes sp.]
MRLIDADEALRLFGKEYEETKELIHNGETQLDSLAEGFTEAHHIIKYVLPSVDAVVVTRCMNCRSYNKPRTGWCEVHLDREHPDDFCSYGKPKEG